MNILVLDVGTSSMRGTLINEHRAVLFRRQVKYQPTFGPGDAVEQDPKDLGSCKDGDLRCCGSGRGCRCRSDHCPESLCDPG